MIKFVYNFISCYFLILSEIIYLLGAVPSFQDLLLCALNTVAHIYTWSSLIWRWPLSWLRRRRVHVYFQITPHVEPGCLNQLSLVTHTASLNLHHTEYETTHFLQLWKYVLPFPSDGNSNKPLWWLWCSNLSCHGKINMIQKFYTRIDSWILYDTVPTRADIQWHTWNESAVLYASCCGSPCHRRLDIL